MPTYHEGNKKIHIQSWGSHVEQQIREAQARGDFDNLPGAGKPLDLEPDNPFAGEWSSAFRVAKNAGAAPLWVELDREIGAESDALRVMLERIGRYLETEAERIRTAPRLPSTAAAPTSATEGTTPARRTWWPFRRATPTAAPAPDVGLAGPQTLDEMEHERQRARTLYLSRAAELDKKIQEFNAHRPRTLSWIEKPRLLPQVAAQRFDERCPSVVRQ